MNSPESVDLPEIKGNHRKFRTLVTSYIGTVGLYVFGAFYFNFDEIWVLFLSFLNCECVRFCV